MKDSLLKESEIGVIIWLAKEIKANPDKLGQTLELLRLKEQRCYNVVSRPKRNGGQRFISIPDRQLKRIQQGLNRHVLARLRPGPNVFGFSGGCVGEAIYPHLNAGSIFCADISSAFSSVRWYDVFKTLASNGISKSAAWLIADLTTFEGTLPQGAPTSPRIFDLVCCQLDFKLAELAKRHNAKNTRYADNIFFSLEQSEFPRQLKLKIIKLLRTFRISDCPLFGWHHLAIKKPTREPVRILGLNIIEQKVHNTRDFKRRLRLAIHHCRWLLDNGKKDSGEFKKALEKLRGQMNFARLDTLGPKLVEDYLALEMRLT